MPFDYEYSVDIQKYASGYKIHYVIPKKYFEGKELTFENFLNKIETKDITEDVKKYYSIFETNDVKSTIDYLRKLKVDVMTDESYFMTVKHHIIQEYKQFNRNFNQARGMAKRLKGEDIYSQLVRKYFDDKACVAELIKTYKGELEFDFKDLVNFTDYNETNIDRLHTNILLALKDHEKDYSGVCFEIVNLPKTDKNCIEDIIYYKFNNKVSTRIMKKEDEKDDSDEESKWKVVKQTKPRKGNRRVRIQARERRRPVNGGRRYENSRRNNN